MKIAFVTSEAFPYAKTGGLADVSGALPKALEKFGCEVKLFMPRYYLIDESKFDLHYNWEIGEISIKVGSHFRYVHIYQSRLPNSNVEVNFIDCPHYFHRDQIYTDGFDEDERFILFSKAVIETLQRLKWAPDVIHANDWPTGLIPLFIKENYGWDKLFSKTASVFTIHNIGYQGRFGKDAIFKAEIKPELFYPESPIEFHGDVSFMKTAINYSDIINTVSKTYAKEILTPEFGAGLEGVLKQRGNDLYGILNGVDYSLWNPEKDTLIPFNFSINNLEGKKKNKKFLLNKVNLKFSSDVPVIGIISRMVSQKGFDLFENTLNELMKLNVQWIILGSGEEKYEEMFTELQHYYPEKVFTYIGFNNEMSHLIEAGTDMLLMPSLYEPCGLNQIYSLKYGTVPIVRKTGGLADTVYDWDEANLNHSQNGNGFSFSEYTGEAMFSAIIRAINYFGKKPIWEKIISNGMMENFSLENSAKEYIKLYKIAASKKSFLQNKIIN
jgi:starch synthase